MSFHSKSTGDDLKLNGMLGELKLDIVGSNVNNRSSQIHSRTRTETPFDKIIFDPHYEKRNIKSAYVPSTPGGIEHVHNDNTMRPKSIYRPKRWDAAVEENYRFQLAGYRDEVDYLTYNQVDKDLIVRWSHNGYVKKLQRKDGLSFYYYNKNRECADKDIYRVKIYGY